MNSPFTPATEIAQHIRKGDCSSVEVVTSYLARIDELDADIGAFTWMDADRTLEDARRADAILRTAQPGERLPPFLGVPIPIKNLTNVAGQPNDHGSWGVSQRLQEQSDLSVERLVTAGFVLMGRTNAPEAGMSQGTDNSRYGSTRNPWNLSRTPGGSSGGAAAAVSAGLAPIASASDGGGSIRMPAACTGLVGLKPSRGRVPSRDFGWEHGLAEGVVTRTVLDSAAVLDVLSEVDPLNPYRAPAPPRSFRSSVNHELRALRVGLLTTAPNGAAVDEACADAAENVAAHLASLGHEVTKVDADLVPPRLLEIYFSYVIPAALHSMDYTDPSKAEPFIQARRARAREVGSGEYVAAVAEMRRLARIVTARWQSEFDVLCTPTLATRVPPVGVLLDEANTHLEGGGIVRPRMLAFVAFVNVLGLPAISLPAAEDDDGLPIGVQLIGAPFEEATLIGLAAALEAEYQWEKRIPRAYRVRA